MANSTGFAALARTSRSAALDVVARKEEHARLTAAVEVEYEDRVRAQADLREAQAEQTRMVQRASEAVRAVWEDEVRRVVDTAEFDNRQNLRRISRLEAELAATRAELAGARAAAVPVPE